MAANTYSPTRAAAKARARRTLDHIRLIPAHKGVVVEHHYRNGDGFQSGEPDRYVHETMDGVHEHLDGHLGQMMEEHEPQERGENAEPTKD